MEKSKKTLMKEVEIFRAEKIVFKWNEETVSLSATKLKSKSKHMDKYKNLLNKDHSIVYNSYNIIIICLWVYLCKYSSRIMILKLDENFEPIGGLIIYLFIY